eukprot:TRINITY_DN708_c0_g1_i8.p1 TRINITY_DN708_c0_g1~~TRINITY_DN708_c0_g1_i8.p1  ORF type:complete len:460 (-),score=64.01 TRINITY_DN708_c0_g1_i8:5-1384(-)
MLSSSPPSQRELLVMTIELNNQMNDILTVREGDAPHSLAYAFCLKHGLPIQAVEALTKSIQENLATLKGETESIQSTQKHPLHEINLKTNHSIRTRVSAPNIEEAAEEACKELQQDVKKKIKKSMDSHRMKETTRSSPRSASPFYVQKIPSTAQENRSPPRNSSSTVQQKFETLYSTWRDVKDRQRVKAEQVHREQCSFKPELCEISQKITENLPPFLDRVSKKMGETEAKLELARTVKEESEKIDPKTGKKLFQPTTRSRSPRCREERKLPVWEYLYVKAKETEKMRSREREKKEKELEEVKAVLNDRSGTIINGLRVKRLTEIFELLDGDKDGLISADRINVEKLDLDLVHIFGPLLSELGELNGDTLNLSEFIDSAELLIKTLSPAERARIFDGPYGSTKEKDCTFHPSINKKSAEIAQKLRPYGSSSLYDHYHEERRVSLSPSILSNQYRLLRYA